MMLGILRMFSAELAVYFSRGVKFGILKVHLIVFCLYLFLFWQARCVFQVSVYKD
jgi:hypothetical protein